MPIPDFQSVLLPLLKYSATKSEVPMKDACAQMAVVFKTTEDELHEKLPSGAAKLFYNRVAWAKQYLLYAGLIEPVRHGVFRITDTGRKWAKEKNGSLKINDFKSIPEYMERVHGDASKVENDHTEPSSNNVLTPEEQIQAANEQIRIKLINDLLERIHQKPPEFFETLVLELMSKLGYGDGKPDSTIHTGKTGDGGIDGIIKMDVLGLEHIFIQAKRYELDKTISREAVAAFAGSVHGAKGVFVTTAKFSPQAIAFVEKNHRQIVLIDGKLLGSLMLRCGLGTSSKEIISIQRIDEDYFSEEL